MGQTLGGTLDALFSPVILYFGLISPLKRARTSPLLSVSNSHRDSQPGTVRVAGVSGHVSDYMEEELPY